MYSDLPKAVGHSVIGPKHEQNENGECEDNWSKETGHDFIILSVADGLGSSNKSAIASEIATSTATSVLNEWLKNRRLFVDEITADRVKNKIIEAATEARQRIYFFAEAKERTIDEFHTTLSIIILTSRWYSVLAVGDSGIVGTKDGIHKKLVNREEGEYSHATTSLVDENDIGEKSRIEFNEESLDLVYLFTDGLDKFVWDLDDRNKPRKKFFDKLVEFASSTDDILNKEARKQFKNFVDDDKFHEHSGDDKTLALGLMPLSKFSMFENPSRNYTNETFIRAAYNTDRPTTQTIADEVGCSWSTANRRLQTLSEKSILLSEGDGNRSIWMVRDGVF